MDKMSRNRKRLKRFDGCIKKASQGSFFFLVALSLGLNSNGFFELSVFLFYLLYLWVHSPALAAQKNLCLLLQCLSPALKGLRMNLMILRNLGSIASQLSFLGWGVQITPFN